MARLSVEIKNELATKRTKLDQLAEEIRDLADEDTLTAGQQEHWTRITRQHKRLAEEVRELDLDARRAFQAEVEQGMSNGTVRQVPGTVTFAHEEFYSREAAVVTSALRSLDRVASNLPAERQDEVETSIRASTQYAAEFEAAAAPEYARAFWKLIVNGESRAQYSFTAAEQDAMAHMMHVSQRAMSEGTPSAGGFAVPVLIDPTVMMTAQGSSNAILDLARKIDVNSNVWKGISSAGVSWSFDAEGATVSDDTPTLAQPSVTVYTARGFIPYSIEIGEDFPGFQAEMGKLLTEGYDELLADKLARGSGSGEPRGILTALDANTNVEVVVTTDGAFGDVDIYKVWKALGERFRNNATWLMSVDVANRVKQFESGNGAIKFPEVANGQLMMRSLRTSSYFPDFTATTGAANLLVVGDFSNYAVARRTLMRVELVPHLVDVTTNRPTGTRGLFAYARIGGNMLVDEGARLLQNQ